MMDRREALCRGTVLPFPGMSCTIQEEIGRGSNGIVYKSFYPDLLNPSEKHVVLIKELFPFCKEDELAVCRDADNAILCNEAGETVWETHRESFEYGNRIHLRMLEKYPEMIGGNLNTFSLNNTLYTVLGCSGGRTLESEYAEKTGADDLRCLTLRMIGLLDSLEMFHESGFLHLDIAPDNILLIGEGTNERVMLIDYNSVYDRTEGPDRDYCSRKEGYTASEVDRGDFLQICEASDLYSVAAVFYRCLTGITMDALMQSNERFRDLSGIGRLQDLPRTVVGMIKQILTIGLRGAAVLRYPSVSAMREAFRELLDRIDGVGVTHWALWEAGKKTVARMIRENPSFAYLRNTAELFASNAENEEHIVQPLSSWIRTMMGPEGKNTFLAAPGGMGKTTAMLRTVMAQPKEYRSLSPAILYVSLYGWKDGDPYYIRNRILENLRFRPDAHSYEDARHMLLELMREPLTNPNRTGEKIPVLLLFLDGLNEASGSTQVLLEEILELSRLPGVRVLVAGRSNESVLPFARLRLTALSEEDVQQSLSGHGLLMPEEAEMKELLKTPMMLAIFLQASRTEQKQLSVRTQNELMEAYLDALRKKEWQDLPEDADVRWQIDAAILYVLPAIAGEFEKKNRALSDTELLGVVERCYRLFSSYLLRRAFPQWIGYSRAIRGDTANAEEWYGIIVRDLLWKRLGLLVRNDSGNYQVIHQIIGEYLSSLDKQNQKRIRKRRWIRNGLIAGMAELLIVGGGCLYKEVIAPQPYQLYAEPVLDWGVDAYAKAVEQSMNFRELLDCALVHPDEFMGQWEIYQGTVRYTQKKDSSEDFLWMLDDMLKSGEVMPWSGEPMEGECYRILYTLEKDRRDDYAKLADALYFVMTDDRADRMYGEEFRTLLDRLINVDAEITAVLYQISCRQHMMDRLDENSPEAESYRSIMRYNHDANKLFSSAKELKSYLNDTLFGDREEYRTEIDKTGIFQVMEYPGG